MKIITCEQVSNGHPDKICDQIADAIVTDCLQYDKNSRVAIEVLIKNHDIVIAGELTSLRKPDLKELVYSVFDSIGWNKLDYDRDRIRIHDMISQQSLDIAMGVDTGGAGDQGMMYGYATSETPELLPIPFAVATRFLEMLRDCDCEYLKADAKAQVSFDYETGKIVTFLCSTQHTEDADIRKVKRIIKRLMKEAALLYGLNTDFQILINPTGRFVIGGSFADCGVTGRKLSCDTYGSVGHIGGGAMCVDGDTEFLTPDGWKPIRDYCGDLVGQWEEGELKFVKPDAYIKSPAEGMMHIRSSEILDMVLSSNHDVVLETSKGGLIKKPVKRLFDFNGEKNGNHGFIPTSFRFNNDLDVLGLSDDLIRLQVAFCADGTIMRHKGKWTGRVRVKKQYKKHRMRYLLNETGTEYKECEDGEFSIFYFCPPFTSKKLSECLSKANSRQFKVIADEVQFWDGEEGTFRTTIKEDADFLQFAFITAYQTNATISIDDRRGESYFKNDKEYIRKSILYRVYSTKWTKFQIKHGNKGVGHCVVEPFNSPDGFMYCFSVPSGMLVLRRNNRVFVTGNSGKDGSKVDRSGAYMARKIARDIVLAGYAEKVEVQIAYAIGVAKPVSIYVDTFGTERQDKRLIEAYIHDTYNLTPKGIINNLGLLDVDYSKVSSYGHFGAKGVPWEQ